MINLEIIIFIIAINLIILAFSIYDEYIAKNMIVFRKKYSNAKIKKAVSIRKRKHFLNDDDGYIIRNKIFDKETDKIISKLKDGGANKITVFWNAKGAKNR